MDLHVGDYVQRNNIVSSGEVMNLFDQVSLDKAFDPPTTLTEDGVIHTVGN